MNTELLQPLTSAAQSLKIGIYEHYKGYRYTVLYIARHSESLEEIVVYQALYGSKEIWVRPLVMFLEDVIINNQKTPRFRFIE